MGFTGVPVLELVMVVLEKVKVLKLEDEGEDGFNVEVQVEDEEPLGPVGVETELDSDTTTEEVDERRVLELGALHADGVRVKLNGFRPPGLHCPASTPQNPAAATTTVRILDETILPEDCSPQW